MLKRFTKFLFERQEQQQEDADRHADHAAKYKQEADKHKPDSYEHHYMMAKHHNSMMKHHRTLSTTHWRLAARGEEVSKADHHFNKAMEHHRKAADIDNKKLSESVEQDDRQTKVVHHTITRPNGRKMIMSSHVTTGNIKHVVGLDHSIEKDGKVIARHGRVHDMVDHLDRLGHHDIAASDFMHLHNDKK